MTLVSVFRALVTSDVVTVATHCCCVPMFTTVIAMNVALSVVDVVTAAVVSVTTAVCFVGAAVAAVFTAVCFIGAAVVSGTTAVLDVVCLRCRLPPDCGRFLRGYSFCRSEKSDLSNRRQMNDRSVHRPFHVKPNLIVTLWRC